MKFSLFTIFVGIAAAAAVVAIGTIEFLIAAIWNGLDTGIDCQLHIVAANTCVHHYRYLQRRTRGHKENCKEKGKGKKRRKKEQEEGEEEEDRADELNEMSM